MEPFKEIVDEWLRADLDAPRKQRHTAKRIHDRLVAECGALGVSYSAVQRYVKRRKEELARAHVTGKVFIVQHHPPGLEAEADFGEVQVRLAGVMTTCFLFVYRMSYSGKAVHRVFTNCAQEAFLEGHVHAFTTLGGLPTGQIRYDNLTSAVQHIVFGQSRARVENPRWQAFRMHYGFEPFYCLPGIEGAHEKGGVEQQVGYFRRNYLVPVPEVETLEELNGLITLAEAQEDERRIGSRIHTIGQDFAAEAPLLRPLPDEPFETGLLLTPRVDRYSQITVRSCRYSVPVHLVGRQVRVVLRSNELVVFDRREEVARHPRQAGKNNERLVLDHYLEVLMRKPGALAHSSVLEAARADGTFTKAHDALWSEARRTLGEAGGTRALIEVLLLHRHMQHDDVIMGIQAALSVGSFNVDVVAVEARKAADLRQRQTQPAGQAGKPTAEPGRPMTGPQVTSLTLKRISELPADERPLPTVDAYDQLLRLKRSGS
jgi:transposase